VYPALAVDPAGRRAFVVPAHGPAAEISLDSLMVSYHELSRRPLLSRLADSLEPVALAAGAPDGPSRYALWLAGDTLAVFGRDDHGYLDRDGHAQLRQTPAGVQLVDTRSWTTRTLDPYATMLTLASSSLLTNAYLWDSSARRASGIGLRVYGADGALRFHLLGQTPIGFVQAVGDRALVRGFGSHAHVLVVDLRRGRVVRTLGTRLTLQLLTSDSVLSR
jgi:hypothetical protein